VAGLPSAWLRARDSQSLAALSQPGDWCTTVHVNNMYTLYTVGQRGRRRSSAATQ